VASISLCSLLSQSLPYNSLHRLLFSKGIRIFNMSGTSSQLASLSTELLLQIFSYLDPVHSTCVGLACRRLYQIHFSKHKRIPLNAFTYDCPISKSHLLTMCYLFSHVGVGGEPISYFGVFYDFLLRQCPLRNILYRAIADSPVT
jgi:hypothetical protein